MKHLLIVVAFCGFFYSCVMNEGTEHAEFSKRSDCIVYTDDVISETYENIKIEYIDTLKAHDCALSQLKGQYLIYFDSICIGIINADPRNNLQLIKKLHVSHFSDSTRIEDIVIFSDSIQVYLGRKCYACQSPFSNNFLEWKLITYKPIDNLFDTLRQHVFRNNQAAWTY